MVTWDTEGVGGLKAQEFRKRGGVHVELVFQRLSLLNKHNKFIRNILTYFVSISRGGGGLNWKTIHGGYRYFLEPHIPLRCLFNHSFSLITGSKSRQNLPTILQLHLQSKVVSYRDSTVGNVKCTSVCRLLNLIHARHQTKTRVLLKILLKKLQNNITINIRSSERIEAI